MFTMKKADLQKLLERFAGLKIGVIGDFALDCYWRMNPETALPSIETGKPTRPVEQQRYAAGAAGNVAMNLVALGCAQVTAFGVIGQDPWGRELLHTLKKSRIDTTGLIQQEQDWATVTYVKPIIGGIEENRIDFGDFNLLHDSTANNLLQQLRRALPALDAIVINAQARAGIHSTMLRKGLQQIIENNPDKIFTVDSREPEAMYAGSVLKINNLELTKACGLRPEYNEIGAWEPLRHALSALYVARQQTVFVTCGAQGIMVCDKDGITNVPAIKWEGETDTTGAGDAVMAAITTTLAAGATPVQAAFTGNLAAAVCIKKLNQTGSASPAEMLQNLQA